MILKSAQTAKTGKQFQKARESFGLSEAQAASKTLINIDFIYAIESGDYSIFPARIFTLRYFSKYAEFLGIKPIFFDIYDVKNAQVNKGPTNQDKIITVFNNKLLFRALLVAISMILLALVISAINSPKKSSEIAQDFNSPDNQLSQNLVLPLEADQEIIIDRLLLAKPMTETAIINVDESKSSEFLIQEGIINNLSLNFFEDSWLELYQEKNKIIFKLFKSGDNLDLSIAPPFKIIAGNASGIVGFYGKNEINFTQVANELNVSLIEVENE